jgi:hypothetical protein
MTRFCLCEERSDVAVHGSVPRGLRGGLLRCARKDEIRVRKDGVAFAMTRFCLCEAEGRGSPLFLRRGWQINLAVRV